MDYFAPLAGVGADSSSSAASSGSTIDPVIDSYGYASEEGSATLCGFSEWLASSPPKKYLTLTSSGGVKQCTYGGTVCGTANPTVALFSRVGTSTYNPSGCSVVYAVQTERRDILSDCSLSPTTLFGAPYQVTQRTTSPVTDCVKTYDGDSYSEVYGGNCQNLGGFSIRNNLSILQDLSNEDTEDDAIARATPSGSGTSNVSYKETRGAADFTFLWQDSTLTVTASSLVIGQSYTITVPTTTEDYGGGGAVVGQIDHIFVASASSEPVVIPIPVASGKQVTAGVPTIAQS